MATVSAKKQNYPHNEAKFIRVKDATGLRTVKEGSVWTYWKGSGTKESAYGNDRYAIISDKIRGDLTLVMLQDKFEISDKNDFLPYIPKRQRDIEAKEIQEKVRQAEERTSQTSSGAPPKQEQSTSNRKSTGQSRESFSSGGSDSSRGKSFVKKEKKKKVDYDIDDRLPPTWTNFSKKEIELLFKLAFKAKTGKDDGVAKDWASKNNEERIEFIEDFIYYELVNKKVPDELLPPLELLKKIPVIANDKELMYYYEKRLGKVKEPQSNLVKLKNGLGFNAKVMPKSFQVAFGVGVISLKAGMALSGALKGLKDKKADKALGKADPQKEKESDSKKETEAEIKNERDATSKEEANDKEDVVKKETTKSEDIKQDIKQDIADKDTSKESIDVVPKVNTDLKGMVSPAQISKTPLTGTSDNKEVGKQLVDKLTSIVKLLSDRLPKKSTADDITKKAENVEGVDKDIEEKPQPPTSKESTPAKEQPKGAGGAESGIFSTILEFLTTPLKSLGAMFSSLGAVLKPLLSIFSSFGGVAKLAGKAFLAAAPVIGLFEAVTDSPEYVKSRFGDNGILSNTANFAERTGNAATFGLAGKLGEQASFGQAALDTAGAQLTSPTETTSSRAKTKAKEMAALQTVSKISSEQVQRAESNREDATTAKQMSTTREIVDASSKSATTIIQQQGGGVRLFPRTQSSTLQKLLDSRSVFA